MKLLAETLKSKSPKIKLLAETLKSLTLLCYFVFNSQARFEPHLRGGTRRRSRMYCLKIYYVPNLTLNPIPNLTLNPNPKP